MIGIETNFKSTYEKIIFDLLKGIPFKDYEWNIVEDELYYENDLTKSLNFYIESGISFEDAIQNLGNYLTLFLNLQVYPKNAKIKSIETYEDFINSKCQLIVLIYDTSYIEIYFKEEKLKNIVLNNMKVRGIKYQIKTKENDGRTIMRVC